MELNEKTAGDYPDRQYAARCLNCRRRLTGECYGLFRYTRTTECKHQEVSMAQKTTGILPEHKDVNQVIFQISREDVIECAREMGLPAAVITDEFLEQVKEGVAWGLLCRDEVVKDAINFCLKS